MHFYLKKYITVTDQKQFRRYGNNLRNIYYVNYVKKIKCKNIVLKTNIQCIYTMMVTL